MRVFIADDSVLVRERLKVMLSELHEVEVIGEAARSLTPEFRREHPELAWNSMVGMRDRLIHGYFDVNLDILWETVTNDLPPLIDKLEEILAD